ncbi:MAG: ATP-dependent metallopeptidase FtsH/Yme1/Tma family protein, partial [Litorivicinus sp.]
MARNLILWMIIAGVLLTVFNNFSMEPQQSQLPYSDFVEEVNRDQVRQVTISGYTISGIRSNGETFETTRPAISDPRLI